MDNKTIIKDFYIAFAQENSEKMNALLAQDVLFEDPAFGKLMGEEVKYMWQFLCENAKDFSLKYEIVDVDADTVLVKSIVHYTFSATGNQVINHITSNFTIHDGFIVEQVDHFDLKKWAKQALGNTIGLVGGSFLLKKIIQKQSKDILVKYIKNNSLLAS